MAIGPGFLPLAGAPAASPYGAIPGGLFGQGGSYGAVPVLPGGGSYGSGGGSYGANSVGGGSYGANSTGQPSLYSSQGAIVVPDQMAQAQSYESYNWGGAGTPNSGMQQPVRRSAYYQGGSAPPQNGQASPQVGAMQMMQQQPGLGGGGAGPGPGAGYDPRMYAAVSSESVTTGAYVRLRMCAA
eukprot:3463079-Rhodomonas_salina.1